MNRVNKKLSPRGDEIDGLLLLYRFWGIATMASFALFLLLLALVVMSGGVRHGMLAATLLTGFLWIGTTSFSRHSFVLLKNSIGKRIGIIEFISTQFAFVLFPYLHRKVKKEIEAFGRGGAQKQEAASLTPQ